MRFLNSPVGNGLKSRSQDIENTKKLLKISGYYGDDDTQGDFITKPFSDSIKTFQKDQGLREDGKLFPGGETEDALTAFVTRGPAQSNLEQFLDAIDPTARKKQKTAEQKRQKPQAWQNPRSGDFAPQYEKQNPAPQTPTGQLLQDIEKLKELTNTVTPQPKPDPTRLSNRGLEATTLALLGEDTPKPPRKPRTPNSRIRDEDDSKDATGRIISERIAIPPEKPFLNINERKQAILGDENTEFNVLDNPEADGAKPVYAISSYSDVTKYKNLIEDSVKDTDIDADLVKAIMYLETTQGYYDRVLPSSVRKSIRPMNINASYWQELGYSREDLKKPDNNIKASIELLTRIKANMPEAGVDKIATIYNNLGAREVSDYGARVKVLMEEKPWEKE